MRHPAIAAIALFLCALIGILGCHKKSTDNEEGASSSITVLSPNGGETWSVGKANEVTWTSTAVGNVKIELNTDYPLGPWETIVANKANNGSYSWRVTQPATRKARVRVRLMADSSASDISDNNFTLADTWTIMIYADGNNYQDGFDQNTSYCIQNLQQMETVNDLYGVNIVAMLSSIRLPDGAKYYKIGYYPMEEADTISSPVVEEKGDADMSNAATLREFLNYCKTSHPAQHYLLVIDDDGEGWRGSCLDEVHGGGRWLTMPELQSAIAESDFHRIDAIAFHAREMAMVEVAYEMRECADFVMASQFVMPMKAVLDGDIWLTWLRGHPDAMPREFCERIVQTIADASGTKGQTIHYVLLESAAISELASKIETFGNILLEENGGYWDEIAHAWAEANVESYDQSQSVDIREFAKCIRLEPHLSQNNLIMEKAADVADAVDAAVLYSIPYFNPSEDPVPRGGLNIHLPIFAFQFDSSDYVALDFASANWQAFISHYLATGFGCPTQCADAADVAVGNSVTTCHLSEQSPQQWFKATLTEGDYRFSLCDFPEGADYDLYTYASCEDFPQNPTRCTSDFPGCDEVTCRVDETTEFRILVNGYAGPMGSYTLSIERVATSAERGRAMTLR